MKYLMSPLPQGKVIRHVCSLRSLRSVIESGHYHPTFTGDYGYDSGLNCYSIETSSAWNGVLGDGAELYMVWKGVYETVDWKLRTPYPKNVLLIFEGWRSFIPIRSDPELCRIVGFNIKDYSQLSNEYQRENSLMSRIPFIRGVLENIWRQRLYNHLRIMVGQNSRLIIDGNECD